MKEQSPKVSFKDRAVLIKSILRLPELQASLIVQFYLQDESSEEIAERLGLSREDFWQEHHAALLRLSDLARRADDDRW
jgi:DNA-directed RNA polymerase specialized sigma24 family protein